MSEDIGDDELLQHVLELEMAMDHVNGRPNQIRVYIAMYLDSF